MSEITKEIQERLDWLACLEAAGVDNWQGIDYAYELYREKHPDND